jgi:hypothetical protein
LSQTLAAVIHGESGAGKSYFGGTLPGPRLILDAEGGSRFIKANKRKRKWDPLTQEPPKLAVEGEEPWDAVVVNILNWKQLFAAYQWLASGRHEFRSVVIDSLTEVQKRLVDDIVGVEQPTLQDWGTIGRNFEDMIRKFRDLTFHEQNPINVAMLCLTHLRDGETRPFLKGAIELALPAFVDVVGFLWADSSTTHANQTDHHMLLSPANKVIAKDRTGALVDKYGPVCTNANFTDWLAILEDEFGDS